MLGWIQELKLSTIIHAVLGVALVLALAWGARVNHLRGQARAETVQLQKDFDAYVVKVRAANAEATAKQKAAIEQKEKENVEKARAADGRYADLREQYAAAVLRAKAASARDRGGPAPGAQAVGADVPEEAATAPQLCISDEDAAKVGDLAAYAQAAHEWAMSLEEAPGR